MSFTAEYQSTFLLVRSSSTLDRVCSCAGARDHDEPVDIRQQPRRRRLLADSNAQLAEHCASARLGLLIAPHDEWAATQLVAPLRAAAILSARRRSSPVASSFFFPVVIVCLPCFAAPPTPPPASFMFIMCLSRPPQARCYRVPPRSSSRLQTLARPPLARRFLQASPSRVRLPGGRLRSLLMAGGTRAAPPHRYARAFSRSRLLIVLHSFR